jgi:hypothetical protein
VKFGDIPMETSQRSLFLRRELRLLLRWSALSAWGWDDGTNGKNGMMGWNWNWKKDEKKSNTKR